MRLLRFWPLGLLLVAGATIWASGLASQISWANLARHQSSLASWIAEHPLTAPAAFTLCYAVAVAVSLPQASILTISAGLLFGSLRGGALTVAGASAGAIALFLIVRHGFADAVAARGGRLSERLRQALQRDGFSYLLAIRLVPLFPFWLVNLAAALSGMRLIPYAAATVIGIMPVTFIYASIGSGLGQVLAAGEQPDIATVFAPRFLLPLAGLAVLALLPVAWRRWRHDA
ncbi:MAG: TVP38/TMEM64 family protein [Acetobacteraceae bacterium]